MKKGKTSALTVALPSKVPWFPLSNTTVQQSENPTTNTMAVVGFVVGLISLLIDFWGLIGIVAIVLSVAGYMGCNQHNQKGKGRAVFGIIFGLASVLYAFFKLLALSGSF